MKINVKEVRNAFEQFGSNGATKLDYLEKWTGGQSIFVDDNIGLIRSEKKMSGRDVADYWSKKIFKSSYVEDYSAINPFAQSRLLYVLLTIRDFLARDKININAACDFATGEGVFLEHANKFMPLVNFIGTETSKDLVESLNAGGLRVYPATLGMADFKGSVDLGVVSWTLCNCIDVVNVLLDIRNNINDDGYLCVADSSRILVPFRKSLKDYFSPWHPLDVHPFYFSYKSMAALLHITGFTVIYSNRYFDSDVLCLIAKKNPIPNDDNMIEVDNPVDVRTFMESWHMGSNYFEQLR